MFHSHVTDKTKTFLSQTNTDIVVIPGCLTAILQSLDLIQKVELGTYNRGLRENKSRNHCQFIQKMHYLQ